MDNNLPEKIREKVAAIGESHEEISGFVNSELTKILERHIVNLNYGELLQDAMLQKTYDKKKYYQDTLEEILEDEMRRSGKLKMVMINLFIAVNIGVFSYYIFGDIAKLPQEAIYGAAGLYVSLATFIFYIYRASNYRTSVVLSIREDAKKYFDVLEYVRVFRSNSELTEYDIDVIRELMKNRAEREKAAKHPYEVIIKGISDANIQVGSGKMIPKKRRKNSESE